jgi:arsenate reductase-like glutaredoxin family protein
MHNQKKQSFLKACNWARRTGETFQKYSMRNICDAKMSTQALSEIEANTRHIMDEIHTKEERTIKSWTQRKNALDECFQYVIFEKSSKEALAWLHESEQSYMTKFQTLGSNRDEFKRVYKEFAEFADRLRNQQVQLIFFLSFFPFLPIYSIIFHFCHLNLHL